jgi:putative ABC transport system permease protein
LNWSASIAIGIRGLLLRKLRSLLSTLGIIFGVAAVISMMSIGEGAKREAIEQIKLLGTNNIRIKRLELTGEKKAEAERRASRGLIFDDVTAIRERFPALIGVSPLKFVKADIRSAGRQATGEVVGTSPDYEVVTNFFVAQGRFITHVDLMDAKKVCVLGSEIKQLLFGPRNALGASIEVGEERFTVVGVLEGKAIRDSKGSTIKVRNINRDVYIPIMTALKRFALDGDASSVQEIAVRTARAEEVSPTARLISQLLRARHRDLEDFEMMIPEELLAQAQRTQRIFNLIMGSIAGISLLVGGIGVMNIMLANISERTREIGIRRAIGATKIDILAQFLVETILICVAGGFIGILIGAGIAKVITLYAGWQTGFTLSSVVIAFGTSASVGLIFGLFPARRAAQMDPVQALRFE